MAINLYNPIPSNCPGCPMVQAHLWERCLAWMSRKPLVEVLAAQLGFEDLIHRPDPKRVRKQLCPDRVLRLFSEDSRNHNGQLLLTLLESSPDILELLLRPLRRNSRRTVLQMFGRQPPPLSPEAAGNCALMLAHFHDTTQALTVLRHILSQSEQLAIVYALTGLFQGNALDFAMLLKLTEGGATQSIISLLLENTQKHQHRELQRHIHIFIALIYHCLPDYQRYWAQCTGLPAESCPVRISSSGLIAGLSRLTAETVASLCTACDREQLIDTTSRLGWRKIQPRAVATLRNPDPACGDFIFRAFEGLLVQKAVH